jgi:hypothetical protein
MSLTVNTFFTDASRRERLLRYCMSYWQPQGPAAAPVPEGGPSTGWEGVEIQELSARYIRAVEVALARFHRSRVHVGMSLGRLCFHCLHMNNNRLGIPAADEAAVASRVLHSCR